MFNKNTIKKGSHTLTFLPCSFNNFFSSYNEEKINIKKFRQSPLHQKVSQYNVLSNI